MFTKLVAHDDATIHAVTGYIDEGTAKRVVTTESVAAPPGSRIVASLNIMCDENEIGVRTAVQLLEQTLDEFKTRLIDKRYKA